MTTTHGDAMGTSTIKGWLRARGETERSGPRDLVDELERELALLREENARLKMARARAATRPVNERVRDALPGSPAEDPADADEPWELLTECMLLRDGLTDACRGFERGACELRERLESILPGAEGAVPGALVGDDLADGA